MSACCACRRIRTATAGPRIALCRIVLRGLVHAATVCPPSARRGRSSSRTTSTKARSSGAFPTVTRRDSRRRAFRPTGTVRPRNGPVVTAGGLVFVAEFPGSDAARVRHETPAPWSGSTSSRRTRRAFPLCTSSKAGSTSRSPPARRGAREPIRCGRTRSIASQGRSKRRATTCSRCRAVASAIVNVDACRRGDVTIHCPEPSFMRTILTSY